MNWSRKHRWLLGGALVLLVLAWWEIGSGERQLIRQLRTGNPEQRLEAIWKLESKPTAKAAAAIAEHVQDPDTRVASSAIVALGNMGRSENIKQVEQQVASPKSELRESAAVALGRSPPQAPVNNQKLAELVTKDESPNVRAAAALSLGRRGVRDAVPALIAALSDPNADVRERAAEALRMIARTPLPFPAHASEEERRAAIELIQKWWDTAASATAKQKEQAKP